MAVWPGIAMDALKNVPALIRRLNRTSFIDFHLRSNAQLKTIPYERSSGNRTRPAIKAQEVLDLKCTLACLMVFPGNPLETKMSAAENKLQLQEVFAEMAKANPAPFIACLADDICWRFKGSTKWTGTYRGKSDVLQKLLLPLTAQFTTAYVGDAQRFIAEEDYVVVEFKGRVTTKAGNAYHNNYCYICRMADRKIVEITEYMDTALADAVLAEPA